MTKFNKTKNIKEVKREIVIEPVEEKVEIKDEVVVTQAVPGTRKEVLVDGAKVLEILEENATAKHCKLSNGTTSWVPKILFQEDNK